MNFRILFLAISYLFHMNSAFAVNATIDWETNTTGKVVFSPDKYSKEPYSYEFNNPATYEIDFKLKVNGQSAQQNFEKNIINDKTPEHIRKAFVLSVHALALQNKYQTADVVTLIEGGHLTIEEDYTVKKSGGYLYGGNISFQVETPMDRDYRLTTINGKSIRTSWTTGKQFIELPASVKKPIKSDVRE